MLIFYITSTIIIHLTSGQNTSTTDVDSYDESQPYCFRFTWIGPEFDNSTRINTTCENILESTRAVGVPCRQPLVITYDATPPQLDYLWYNHKDAVLCKQRKGQVCAKYSYSINNELQNVTYMCAKVYAKGEGAVTPGCHKQIVNDYEVELCTCKSVPGPGKPCNSAVVNSLSFVGLTVLLILLSFTFN